MSKRRKRHHGGRPDVGGTSGRVTPKGTRPQNEATRLPSGGSPFTDLTGPSDRIGLGEAGALGGFDPFDPLDSFSDGLPSDVAPFDGDPLEALLGDLEVVRDRDPLQIEMWAAGLVGGLRAGLQPSTPFEPAGDAWDGEELPSEEEFFSTLVQSLTERSTGPNGMKFFHALHAIQPFLPAGAAAEARAAVAERSGEAPRWSAAVGHATVESCFVIDHETDDAHNLAIVARHPGADAPFMTMTLIDVNLGGLAKDIFLADAIDEVRAESVAEGFTVIDIEPGVARARLEQALEITDRTIMAPVSDDFDGTRPLLERLIASMPDPVEPPTPAEPSTRELERLAEQLVDASAEQVSGQIGREDLRAAADLALGFMAHQMGRSPVAWSPTRLEILLMDYVPRKVAAPPEELIGLPEELIALLPAAHELAGWGRRHLDDAIELVRHFGPQFRELISDPSSGGSAKQMVMRAIAEGLDLEDPGQLQALMDRMNASGGIDAFTAGADIEWVPPDPIDTALVPPAMRDRVAEIDQVMGDVAIDLFDPEHLELCRHALVRLAHEHPEELVRFKAESWGGGIPYGIAQANKMFDYGWWSELDVAAAEVAQVVEMSQSTLAKRGKEVRQLLDLDHWPPPAPYFRSDVRRRYDALTRRSGPEPAEGGG